MNKRVELNNLLMFEFKRVMLSKKTYVCLIIIILSSLITLNRNYYFSNLANFETIGTLNLFIYSFVKGNNIVILLSPLIAAIVYSITIFEDIRQGFYKQIVIRCSFKKYISAKIVSSLLFGGLLFVVSCLLLFVILLFIDASSSVRTDYYRNILFVSIYDQSLLLYCLINILYAFIYGAIYSLLAMGIVMFTRNKYITLIAPVTIYYIANYYLGVFPKNIAIILRYIFPYLTFDTTTGLPPIQYVTQLSVVIILAVIFILISSRKLRMECNL